MYKNIFCPIGETSYVRCLPSMKEPFLMSVGVMVRFKECVCVFLSNCPMRVAFFPIVPLFFLLEPSCVAVHIIPIPYTKVHIPVILRVTLPINGR